MCYTTRKHLYTEYSREIFYQHFSIKTRLNTVLIFRLGNVKYIVIKNTYPLRFIWLDETYVLHWRYYSPTNVLDIAYYKHKKFLCIVTVRH